jgi:hypothetical protein
VRSQHTPTPVEMKTSRSAFVGNITFNVFRTEYDTHRRKKSAPIYAEAPVLFIQ